MNSYDADRQPDPTAWLELEENTKLDLVVAYHRRHRPRIPRVRLHATFHTIVENLLAASDPVVLDTLNRLRHEGLSRHDAIHAIGSVLAAQVYDALKNEQPDAGKDRTEAFSAQLRELTAKNWHNTG